MVKNLKNNTVYAVVHTPFQLEYVNNIKRKFDFNSFYIISTLKINAQDHNLIVLNNSINSILKLKYLIRQISFCNKTLILIPHLKGFVSSILYQNFKNFSNISFALFYEGIALFRNPEFDNSLTFKEIFKRTAISIIFNLKYKTFLQAPLYFRKKAFVFSPISNNYLNKTSKKIFITPLPFPKNLFNNKKVKSVMYVCHKNDNLTIIQNKIAAVQKHFDHHIKEIYIKPHLETNISSFSNKSHNYIFLDKYETLESLVSQKNFIFIFSHFSSAIINLHLMGFQKSNLIVINKERPIINFDYSELCIYVK